MIIRKLVFSAIMTIFLSQRASTQFGGEGQHVGMNKQFNPIPSSPNVAAFEKFGNLPVNYNTGIPQIEIPVYVIALNGFKWPINLSYHAGGFKSEDIAPRTGLGWVLNASGVISTTQTLNTGSYVSLPYDLDLGYYSYGNSECLASNDIDIGYAEGIVNGTYTTEPPLNNINTVLFSGKFLGNGYMLPASDMKIQAQFSGGTLIGWHVYDDAGNKFEFMTSSANSRTSSCQGVASFTHNVSFHLSKIITNKGDTITFTYDSENYNYTLPDLHIKKIINANQIQRCNSSLSPEDYYCDNNMYATEKRLTKIESTDGTVVDISYSSRTDLPGSSKLDHIDISYKVGGSTALRKKITLSFAYFGTGTDPSGLQLKLTDVTIKGNDGSTIMGAYHLFYNSTPLPNKLDEPISFPTSDLNYAVYVISKAGILEKIQYPTGGYTTLDYEVLTGYGVLRITEMKDFAFDGQQASYRKFEYNDDPPDNIQAVFTEGEQTYYFGNPQTGAPPSCMEDLPCQNPFNWLIECARTLWKNVPVRNSMQDYIDITPRYGHVTELFGSTGENGKTDYIYGIPGTSRGISDILYLTSWPGYLVQKDIYKKNSNGTYSLVTRTLNEYVTSSCDNVFFDETPDNPKEHRFFIKKVFMLRPEMLLGCCDAFDTKYCFQKLFLEQDIRVSSVPVYLSKTTERQYNSSGDFLKVETQYYYNNGNYIKPTKIEVKNSKDQLIETQLKYPFDFSGTSVYDAMITRNNINPVIEQIKKNVTLNLELDRTKNNYQYWQSNTLTEPATIQKSIAGNTLETEITLQDYGPRGNILQYVGRDGITNSFVWGYGNAYPIAQVVNASRNNISYTSFEADEDVYGSIHWQGIVPGSIVTNTNAITGVKHYDKSSFSLSRASLNSSTEYIVSYWSRSGSYSVSGTQSGWPKQFKTVNINGQSWTLYEHLVTGVTTVTVSGSGIIDELRLYPKTAQMTTYTYSPLIGVLTECDINNRVLYYEYDLHNRLKLIRDQDRNILKSFDYKLLEQQ